MTDQPHNDPSSTINNPINPTKQHGIWIGIDLGTSNCTASYWDTQHNRSRSIRFPSSDLSRPVDGGRKGGTILPSCVAYAPSSVGKEEEDDGVVGVGVGAVRYLDQYEEEEENEEEPNEGGEMKKTNNDETTLPTIVSSVKRIWGMTKSQIQTELELDPSFLSSLPFEVTLGVPPDDGSTDGEEEENEGSRLCIPLPTNDTNTTPQIRFIPPLHTAIQLLRTIRLSSQTYFATHPTTIVPLGRSTNTSTVTPFSPNQNQEVESSSVVRNCIIGVPAHFGRNRCNAIVRAARRAGFDGYVGTMVESTAAAVAYGLDVGVMADPNGVRAGGGGKMVLVFDMGGGTTDVTVARLDPPRDDDDDGGGGGGDGSRTEDEPTFRVLATAGDRRLGGDDMDEALARYLVEKFDAIVKEGTNETKETEPMDWKLLRRKARAAKEELCGDGTPDHLPQTSVVVTFPLCDTQTAPMTYELNQDELRTVIQPLIERASSLVRTTLSSCPQTPSFSSSDTNSSQTTPQIDEVILVGGATRCPSIPDMLRSPTLFHRSPTKEPMELCTSISGNKAVSQGLAIHAAVVSRLLPRHVLRNATMLDVLPHTIGVLLPPRGEEEEMYVPILERGSRLPARGYASFELADVEQTGVSVTAVEDVGEEFGLERLGEFRFLLHRLSKEEAIEELGVGGRRSVDVGMTIETDGRLIVSVFDENDPEDLKKKEAYQKWKRRKEEREMYEGEGGVDETFLLGFGEVKNMGSSSREEFLLSVGCLGLFCAYMALRFWFHEAKGDSSKIF